MVYITTIIRWMCYPPLVYLIYLETGKWTAFFVVMITVGTEINTRFLHRHTKED